MEGWNFVRVLSGLQNSWRAEELGSEESEDCAVDDQDWIGSHQGTFLYIYLTCIQNDNGHVTLTPCSQHVNDLISELEYRTISKPAQSLTNRTMHLHLAVIRAYGPV